MDNIGITDPLGAVSDAELDTLLEEQIQVSMRLSQIVDCPTSDPADIAPAMERAFSANAPYLVEIVIGGKP